MASPPPRLAALLWDVDGTLAETERDGHRVAFNRAFEGCGLPWRWDDRHYGRLLRVSGGFERLLNDMANRADAPVCPEERAALARAVHTKKNAYCAPGSASAGVGAIGISSRPLPRLRAAFTRARLRVCLDGGFAVAAMFACLEREGLEYVVAMGNNGVIRKASE